MPFPAPKTRCWQSSPLSSPISNAKMPPIDSSRIANRSRPRCVARTAGEEEFGGKARAMSNLGGSLRRLKKSSRERRSIRGPPPSSAASSHALNDAYMQEMEDAFQSMYPNENV